MSSAREKALQAVRMIRPIKQSAEANLLKLSGVTGVDIGYKYVKGKKTDEMAIRVYVAKKKAEKDVPSNELIPKTLEGVKTDVIERVFVLHPLRMRLTDLEIKADTGSYDPLKGGISIGPCRIIGGYIHAGTLGAIVRDNATNDPMLLSNFHVMCVDTGWSVGDTMAQPSRVDGGTCPADVVGQLQRASLGGQVDCAVASHTARGYACEIVDIGGVTGTATAVVGMAVRKRGRTTGLTYGEVDTVDLTVNVDYEDGIGVVTLTNQIGIDVDASKSAKFGDHGDSGSVVVNDNRRVVGLYFAGTPDGSYGVANPILAVLNALDVKMCVAAVKKAEPDKWLFKEHKPEKLEVKELKYEIKETKEWKERKDTKEVKEHKPEKYEVEGKAPFSEGPLPPRPPRSMASVEDRLDRLEAAVGQLTHFIRPELRPDLSKGALKREPDQG